MVEFRVQKFRAVNFVIQDVRSYGLASYDVRIFRFVVQIMCTCVASQRYTTVHLRQNKNAVIACHIAKRGYMAAGRQELYRASACGDDTLPTDAGGYTVSNEAGVYTVPEYGRGYPVRAGRVGAIPCRRGLNYYLFFTYCFISLNILIAL